MLRILIAAVCLSLSGSLCAQAPFSFMEDGNGRPLFIQSNYVSEGSPYFNDDYIMAQVTALNGAICHNVQVKINLVDHIVQYLGHGGKEMITETPVKEIRFTQYVFEDGHVGELVLVSYAGAMNAPNAVIYQVVDSGKLTLLKNTFITYRDDKKYGSASTTRIFDRKETYSVLLPDGRVKHIEKGRENILSLFPDKQKQVDNFIEQDKLKCNSGKDYDLIFRFYNAL